MFDPQEVGHRIRVSGVGRTGAFPRHSTESISTPATLPGTPAHRTKVEAMANDNVYGWRYYGQERPAFALEPGPGQESVWDYPRPPRIVRESRDVIVRVGEVVIAQTHEACRVLETASPPTFYIPRADVKEEYLGPAAGSSRCEWKGTAR